MPPKTNTLPPELAPYIGRRPLKPRFWLRFAFETLGVRSLPRLVRSRTASESITAVEGLIHIPASGVFVLAVNHYSGRAAYDITAVVLSALSRTRPDALEQITIVVGHRRAVAKSRVQSLIFALTRRGLDWVFHRWRAHTVRIPLKNPEPSPAGLRSWRDRQQPVFVFPEGRARVRFGAIRRGAGRWLAALELPVVPVGVWWMQDSGWTVRFGPPLDWTPRADLLDVQLGLEIAALLPEALAFDWLADLARWRAAHQPR